MLGTIAFGGLCLITAACLAQATPCALPQPHFHAQASDPPWLETVARFHGHLGPSVVTGARLGMAGLRAVAAKGYFDVDVTCAGPFARPPESCFLDGVQVATGATSGKQNLHSTNAEQTVLRIRNTRTGKTVEVRPTKKLVELLKKTIPPSQGGGRPHEDRLERTAREISAMPDEEILTTELVR
jgi:formylmethanofuran dehydrogenase subunit E